MPVGRHHDSHASRHADKGKHNHPTTIEIQLLAKKSYTECNLNPGVSQVSKIG